METNTASSLKGEAKKQKTFADPQNAAKSRLLNQAEFFSFDRYRDGQVLPAAVKKAWPQAPDGRQVVRGFAVGTLVVTHSLKCEQMNHALGVVTGDVGDRVSVCFHAVGGEKAITPENLEGIESDEEREKSDDDEGV